MWPEPRPTSIPSGILIHPAVWPQYTWAEKWGCCTPFLERGLGPHLTQCRLGRGLPPYQVSSWSIQPLGHSIPTLQTDKTDKTDRQRSDSIGRTILQTVPQILEMRVSLRLSGPYANSFSQESRCQPIQHTHATFLGEIHDRSHMSQPNRWLPFMNIQWNQTVVQ